jgi:hypothetical protein
MTKSHILGIVIFSAVACSGVALLLASQIPMAPLSKKSLQERLDQYGPQARARLEPHFKRANVPYPPAHLTLVALKEERLLNLYASDKDGKNVKIHSYPILAASGGPGPKLKEGDRQVPEGIYAIESLNPNSRFHLSLRVNYPNAFDKEMATADGRDLKTLGGDIMIHGSNVSVGCLAMGDPAAEELFTLAADTKLSNITLIIAPFNLAARPVPAADKLPLLWQHALYLQIQAELKKLP